MRMNTTDLMLVLKEVPSALQGGWIQKIHQPTDRTLVFDIRVPGRTHRLLISCEPQTARLHLTSRSQVNPSTPPPFCQFLRAHFQGARIDDMCQISNGPVVELHLTTREGSRSIACELTGPQANVLALDAERRVLRDLAHQRDLVGQPYVAPVRNKIGTLEGEAAHFTGETEHEFPISDESK